MMITLILLGNSLGKSLRSFLFFSASTSTTKKDHTSQNAFWQDHAVASQNAFWFAAELSCYCLCTDDRNSAGYMNTQHQIITVRKLVALGTDHHL
jgi:hypothetical protein